MFKQKFAIKTLNTILIEPNQTGELLSTNDKTIAVGILRDNGYILTPFTFTQFMNTDVSVETGKNILESVKELRGGNVNHQTLIGKFPIQDPNQLSRSLVSFVNHISSIFDSIPDMLQDDVSLYNLSEKGNLVYLNLSETIDKEINELLLSKIPLSLDHEEFVAELYKANDPVLKTVDSDKIVLKEILARHIAMELQTGAEKLSARNSIDVLRAIALISGEPDAKLDNKFKIKSLSNPMRKQIVITLDKVANIEDVVAKKGLFKKLFKLLHVHENRFKEYENIRNLAKQLQTINNPKTIRTDLYELVKGIGTKEGFDAILNNPSIFIRNLDAILRKYDADSVLELFVQSLKTRDVETKLLLQILEHFRNRDEDISTRLINLKGKSSPVVVEKELPAIESYVIEKLNDIIMNELKRQYSKGENFYEKVYIHPSLYKVNIPKGLSSQDGLKTISRGSRYKIKTNGDVIRMFVHWADSVDVDLSAIVLDHNYNTIDSINFGNLSGHYYEHSGDVRSAPNGGTEHIDIYLDNLPKNTKYIGMALNTYSGERYDDIQELFAGFMVREDRFAGKRFEAKTVEDKFSIGGGVEFKLVLLFDVETREVIMINSSQSSYAGSSIHSTEFGNIIKGVLDRKYVTVGELLSLHSNYVLIEDEQLTMSDEELEKVKVFDEEFGLNVIEITSKLL